MIDFAWTLGGGHSATELWLSSPDASPQIDGEHRGRSRSRRTRRGDRGERLAERNQPRAELTGRCEVLEKTDGRERQAAAALVNSTSGIAVTMPCRRGARVLQHPRCRARRCRREPRDRSPRREHQQCLGRSSRRARRPSRLADEAVEAEREREDERDPRHATDAPGEKRDGPAAASAIATIAGARGARAGSRCRARRRSAG